MRATSSIIIPPLQLVPHSWTLFPLSAGSLSWSSSMTSMKPTCRRKSTLTGRRGSQTPGCTAAYTSYLPRVTGEDTYSIIYPCATFCSSFHQLFPQLQRWTKPPGNPPSLIICPQLFYQFFFSVSLSQPDVELILSLETPKYHLKSWISQRNRTWQFLKLRSVKRACLIFSILYISTYIIYANLLSEHVNSSLTDKLLHLKVFLCWIGIWKSAASGVCFWFVIKCCRY